MSKPSKAAMDLALMVWEIRVGNIGISRNKSDGLEEIAGLIAERPEITRLLRGGLVHRIGDNCPHCESEPCWQHKSWCPETDWEPQKEVG